jgi:hypothetical protein
MAKQKSNAPLSFWVLAVVALLWNLLGMTAYVAHVSVDQAALAVMPDAERLLYETFPTWATAAFAIAVTAGVLGSVALLLRKNLATPLFAISLLAVLVQDYGSFVVSDAMAVYGPASIVMPVAVVLFGVVLVWYSARAGNKGWTN